MLSGHCMCRFTFILASHTLSTNFLILSDKKTEAKRKKKKTRRKTFFSSFNFANFGMNTLFVFVAIFTPLIAR